MYVLFLSNEQMSMFGTLQMTASSDIRASFSITVVYCVS